MFHERLLGFLMIFIKLYFCIYATLFPESRHWSPYLHMRKAIIIYENYLLCFTKVSNLTLYIESSWIIPCSTFLPWSPRDQKILKVLSLKKILKMLDWTLNNDKKPFFLLNFKQGFKHVEIPCIFLLDWISFSVWCPWKGEIIFIWEIETFLK